MAIHHKINLVHSKTIVRELKDGVVMISFSDYFWDNTCLLNFRFNSE
jgi:hypothetical protein